MENEEDKKLEGETKEKIFQIFKDFFTRVAKLDELVAVGGRLLAGFQQGLEFLRRPPINKTSKLIENIIRANETKRLKSYLEAGCINSHDSVENMIKCKNKTRDYVSHAFFQGFSSNLPCTEPSYSACFIWLLFLCNGLSVSEVRTCLLGLHDHLIKVKSLLNDLKCLLEDATAALQMANEQLSPLLDKESVERLDPQENNGEDEMASSHLQEPQVTDYAALMGIIYNMVKQDYAMQDKIVTSLNLKSSSGELESYCLMWSLRPYINDQIMHLAWKLVP